MARAGARLQWQQGGKAGTLPSTPHLLAAGLPLSHTDAMVHWKWGDRPGKLGLKDSTGLVDRNGMTPLPPSSVQLGKLRPRQGK
jgi:hypothetical protein